MRYIGCEKVKRYRGHGNVMRYRDHETVSGGEGCRHVYLSLTEPGPGRGGKLGEMGGGCQKLLERRGGAGREAICYGASLSKHAPRKDAVWLTELRLQLAAVLQGSLPWRASRMKAALVYPCPWLIALQGCAGDC